MCEKKSVKVQKRQHAPTYCSRGQARRRRGGRNTYICIRRRGSVLHVHAVGAAVVSVALFGMGPANVGVLLQQTTIDAVSFLNRRLISGGKKRKKKISDFTSGACGFLHSEISLEVNSSALSLTSLKGLTSPPTTL